MITVDGQTDSIFKVRYGGRGADRKAPPPEPNRCLGVFGLSLHTTERELEKHFSTFGRIKKCQLALDVQSGRSKGFAFIEFESIDDAKEARKEMDGKELGGKSIRIEFAIEARKQMDGKELDGKPIRIDFSKDSALNTFEAITDFVRRRGGVRGRDDIMEDEIE